MCDIVKKVLLFLKPYASSVTSDKDILDIVEKNRNSLNDLKNFVDSNATRIFNYTDKETIGYLLDKAKSNFKEYDAYKYVFFSPVEDMKRLPQYAASENYIKKLYQCLLLYAEHLDHEYYELSKRYENDMIMEKYYTILSKENVFIEDVTEFLRVIEHFILTIDEKIALIKLVIEANNQVYDKDFVPDKQEYDLLEFQRIIESNANLLNSRYQELLDFVDDYIDVTKDLSISVDDNIIRKIDVRNILLAKKVWLIKRININYDAKNYDKVSKMIDEFNNILAITKRIEKITDKQEIVRVIKGEC